MEHAKRNTPKFILLTITKVVVGLLVLYAIVFSLAISIGGYILYKKVSAPLNEIKALATTNPAQSAYMARYRAELLADGQSDTLLFQFTPLDSISIHLRNAALAAEDDGFYAHPGFDIDAIISALEHNRNRQGIQRGASTISQQLAKNMFLTSERSFERKYKELVYTLLMEHYLGKDRIFELYLNYAQWGKNIFGCEAASQYYFNKPSKLLTKGESARMAAVLAMPSKITPLNTTSSFMGKRLAVIANNLYLGGTLDDNSYYTLTGTYPPGKDLASDTIPNMQDSLEPPPM